MGHTTLVVLSCEGYSSRVRPLHSRKFDSFFYFYRSVRRVFECVMVVRASPVGLSI